MHLVFDVMLASLRSFLELLHNKGFLCCVFLKFLKCKDLEMEVLAHVANGEAFPKGVHVFLPIVWPNELHIKVFLLQFRLFSCHDLVATSALVTWGQVRVLDQHF